MKLYLVQHGEARSKEEDPERPLTERGGRDIRAVAGALAPGAVTARRILHSGKTRARQTADLLAERVNPAGGVHAADGLDPLADPAPWAERVDGETGDLALVGHLPHLGRLASLLLCDDAERTVVTFQQGGILCLERDDGGAWSVRWMLVPGLVAPTG